ncbi:hypothetical protein EV121DRAFT_297492 [Schizophyllum commune]
MPGRSTEENEKRVLCVKVTKMLILGSGGLFIAQALEKASIYTIVENFDPSCICTGDPIAFADSI